MGTNMKVKDLTVKYINEVIDRGTKSELKYGGNYKFEGVTYKHVEDHGGEGQGEDYWVVFSADDGETKRYFMANGYYASYEGSTWEGNIYEVFPALSVEVSWSKKSVERVTAEQAATLADEFYKRY